MITTDLKKPRIIKKTTVLGGQNERLVSRVFVDKNGSEIKEYDVLKIFHFVGARRKKHYMYKWVRLDKHGHLAISHLDDSEDLVPLAACSRTGKIYDAEIVQTKDC